MAFCDPWWIFLHRILKLSGQMKNEGHSGYEVCNPETSSKHLRKKPTSENLLLFLKELYVCYQLLGMIIIEGFSLSTNNQRQ